MSTIAHKNMPGDTLQTLNWDKSLHLSSSNGDSKSPAKEPELENMKREHSSLSLRLPAGILFARDFYCVTRMLTGGGQRRTEERRRPDYLSKLVSSLSPLLCSALVSLVFSLLPDKPAPRVPWICSLCCSSLQPLHDLSPHLFKSLLQYHIFQRAFPDHPTQNRSSITFYPLTLLYFFLCSIYHHLTFD